MTTSLSSAPTIARIYIDSTYSATDAAGNSSTATRSVIVGAEQVIENSTTTYPLRRSLSEASNLSPTDSTAPVVTLVGAAAMQIDVSQTYTDPGATALDDTDGDITAQIVVTGSVDTATAGLYTLTYTATDAAGNIGSVSRVMTVIAPII